MKALGLLVVDHLVGFDGGAVVVELHIADRRHPRIIVVVIDLVGLDQHLVVVDDLRRRRAGRARIVGEALSRRRCRRRNSDHTGYGKANDERQQRQAGRRHAPLLPARDSTRPDQAQPLAKGGDHSH